MRTFTYIVLLATFLSGCGYKGPLYLPAPEPEAKQAGTVAAPEPAPERPVPAQSAPPPK